jgi:hypothetical protein
LSRKIFIKTLADAPDIVGNLADDWRTAALDGQDQVPIGVEPTIRTAATTQPRRRRSATV